MLNAQTQSTLFVIPSIPIDKNISFMYNKTSLEKTIVDTTDTFSDSSLQYRCNASYAFVDESNRVLTCYVNGDKNILVTETLDYVSYSENFSETLLRQNYKHIRNNTGVFPDKLHCVGILPIYKYIRLPDPNINLCYIVEINSCKEAAIKRYLDARLSSPVILKDDLNPDELNFFGKMYYNEFLLPFFS